MHESEIRLLEQILDDHRDKPRCPHLTLKEGVVNYEITCQQIKEGDNNLSLHELQLWCLDGERCKNCIYHKKVAVSWDQLNNFTLDVADLLKKQGIDGFQYYECLNFLRSNLSRSLEFNGYRVPGLGYVDWDKCRKERTKGE